MWKNNSKSLQKKIIIILTIIFFLVFSIFFLQKNKFLSTKKNNSTKKNFITKENYLKNPEKIKEKILEKNKAKIIKIISKKNLKIYKNYDYFQVVKENIKINNKIANWFFITNNWIILTNKHILEDKENIEYIWITSDKKEYKLKILYKFKNKDLAILKILDWNKKIFKKVDFIKNYEKTKNNDFIFSLNSDKKIFFWKILNKSSKINFLKINENNINFLKEKKIKNLIESNLKTNFWDSGSPLFNNKNEVIWINTLRQNNKNYSIILDEKKIKNILNFIK
jgi:S1-C subfamily serine protease